MTNEKSVTRRQALQSGLVFGLGLPAVKAVGGVSSWIEPELEREEELCLVDPEWRRFDSEGIRIEPFDIRVDYPDLPGSEWTLAREASLTRIAVLGSLVPKGERFSFIFSNISACGCGSRREEVVPSVPAQQISRLWSLDGGGNTTLSYYIEAFLESSRRASTQCLFGARMSFPIDHSRVLREMADSFTQDILVVLLAGSDVWLGERAVPNDEWWNQVFWHAWDWQQRLGPLFNFEWQFRGQPASRI